jgi:hypothetical protein
VEQREEVNDERRGHVAGLGKPEQVRDARAREALPGEFVDPALPLARVQLGGRVGPELGLQPRRSERS